MHDVERNPAGEGVYFVKGDPTSSADLQRAGIEEASAALIFPSEPSNDADMRSILTIMAIESVAPGVRTVAEVNNAAEILFGYAAAELVGGSVKKLIRPEAHAPTPSKTSMIVRSRSSPSRPLSLPGSVEPA